ncbi:uncharacterized protein METZ01_LOCUS104085, partial [marine metagenome]
VCVCKEQVPPGRVVTVRPFYRVTGYGQRRRVDGQTFRSAHSLTYQRSSSIMDVLETTGER